MMKLRLWLIVALATIALFAGYAIVQADSHPTIRTGASNATSGILLKGIDGVSNVGGTHNAYSPKATCTQACHVTYTTGLIANTLTGSCVNAGSGEWNCTANYHDYGSGVANVIQETYYRQLSGTWRGPAYSNATSYMHGASSMKHAQMGRNEVYPAGVHAAAPTGWGQQRTTSSPGMYGRF